MANKQLMFHSNNYFDEQQIKEDEGAAGVLCGQAEGAGGEAAADEAVARSSSG